MRFVSKATLAAALAAGTVTMALGTTAPATAQDNKAGSIQVSKEFRTAAAAAETALKAQDWNTAQARLAEASAIAKSDDERYFVAALGVPVAANLKDDATLVSYLDTLIANPKTPPADLGRYNFLRGNVSFGEKKSAEALPYLEKARGLGFQNDNLPLMLASGYFDTGKLNEGVAEIDKAILAKEAAGEKAPSSWYDFAISRLYAAKNGPATAQWLQRQVKAYPTPTNWHKSIAVYRAGAQLEKGQQIDLYRLQRQANAMANLSDYLEYGELTNGTGLPYETKTLIEQGRANGKIPASQATANQMLSQANSAIKSEGSLDASEKRAHAAANGTIAAATGNAYLASGNHAKAIELFELALQKGSVNAEEVNTRLGIAQAIAGQKDAARQSFAKVTTSPRKEIASFWTLWLDIGSTGPAPAAS